MRPLVTWAFPQSSAAQHSSPILASACLSFFSISSCGWGLTDLRFYLFSALLAWPQLIPLTFTTLSCSSTCLDHSQLNCFLSCLFAGCVTTNNEVSILSLFFQTLNVIFWQMFMGLCVHTSSLLSCGWSRHPPFLFTHLPENTINLQEGLSLVIFRLKGWGGGSCMASLSSIPVLPLLFASLPKLRMPMIIECSRLDCEYFASIHICWLGTLAQLKNFLGIHQQQQSQTSEMGNVDCNSGVQSFQSAPWATILPAAAFCSGASTSLMRSSRSESKYFLERLL